MFLLNMVIGWFGWRIYIQDYAEYILCIHDYTWSCMIRWFGTSVSTEYMLVGGLEHDFYFPIYLECHHPNWLYIWYFSEGRYTTNQICLYWIMLVGGDWNMNFAFQYKLGRSSAQLTHLFRGIGIPPNRMDSHGWWLGGTAKPRLGFCNQKQHHS